MSETRPQNEQQPVCVDLLKVCGVDFNLLHILDNVFDYLSGKDLASVSCVNKTWSNVVQKSKCANKRKLQYLNDIRNLKEELGEENWPIKRGPIEQRTLEPRLAFSDIKNTKKKAEKETNLTGTRSAAVISTTTKNKRLRRAIFTPLKGCDKQCIPLTNTIPNTTYLFSEDTKRKVLLGSTQSKRNLKRL